MNTDTFLRRLIFSVAIILLLTTLTSAADESITISSPSNDTTFEHGEQIEVYVQTTNSSMTKSMLQTSDNLGTWDPMDQIDDNLFVKTWNTSQLDNKNSSYIISAKTSISDKDYYDSINVEIEESAKSTDNETDGDNNLTVDGLKDGATYNLDESIWVQVVDEETTNPVSSPSVKIQDPGKYMVSVTAEGYDSKEYLVNLEEPEEEEEDEPRLDVMGLEDRVLVDSKTDIWVMDSENDEPVEEATVKLVDKESNTVIRSEKTTDYGEVYWHWDIKGYFTMVISKPGYDKVTTSVRVVPESDLGKHQDFDYESDSDSGTDNSDDTDDSDNNSSGDGIDGPDEDLTLREVEQYLENNHRINGEPYQIMSPKEIERIVRQSYQQVHQNATAAAEEDEGPITGFILSNPILALIGMIAFVGVAFAGGTKIGRDGAALNIDPSRLMPKREPEIDEEELTMNNDEVPDIHVPYPGKNSGNENGEDDETKTEQDQSTGNEQEETQAYSTSTAEKSPEERLMELLTDEQKQELLKSLDSSDQGANKKDQQIPEEPDPEEFTTENQNQTKSAPKQPFDTSEYDHLVENIKNEQENKNKKKGKGGGKK